MNAKSKFIGPHFLTLNLKASNLTLNHSLRGNICSQSTIEKISQNFFTFSILFFLFPLFPLHFLLKNIKKQIISCKLIFTSTYFPLLAFFDISDNTNITTEIFYPRKWPKRQGWASIHCSSTPCIITEQHFFMRNAIALRTTLNNK